MPGRLTRHPFTGETVEDELLIPYEIAEMFRVDPKTVNRWIHQRKLASFRTPGGHHRVWLSELTAFMDTETQGDILRAGIDRVVQGIDR